MNFFMHIEIVIDLHLYMGKYPPIRMISMFLSANDQVDDDDEYTAYSSA